jgi:hypothetical protein
VKLGARADEIAAEIREVVPAYRPSDEITVRLLAVTLARSERAFAALEDAAPGDLARLEQDARGWVNRATALVDKLGMTPTARARLRLDVAQTARALNVTDLHAAALELEEGTS